MCKWRITAGADLNKCSIFNVAKKLFIQQVQIGDLAVVFKYGVGLVSLVDKARAPLAIS